MVRYAFLILMLGFFSCGNERNKSNPKQEEEKVVKETKDEPLELHPDDSLKNTSPNRINNENVQERLIEYGSQHKESVLDIYTTKGKIRVQLYRDTPLHRANFLMLTKAGYFKKNVFNRIHKDFIAQTGGTYEEETVEILNAIGKYTIPAEIKANHFHKAGALGAARSYVDNPDKRSHATQFYFIEGSRFNEITLDKYQKDNNYTYPSAHREYYLKNKGAAHLDGQHTVFGEIISGLDVVSRLTDVPTSSNDRPYEDLYIDSIVVVR